MAIVYSYPKVTSPLATDVLVLTDTTVTAGKRKNKTKSIAMSDVATYVIDSKSGITGSGTLNTFPIFTASTIIGDSIITQAALGQGITVAGNFDVTNDTNLQGSLLADSLEVSNDSVFTGSARFNSTIKDTSGGVGTNGQVLTSTGTGVAWATDAGGSVTGTGTTNYIAKWNTSSSIQDSIIFDNGTNVGIGTASPTSKLDVSGRVDFSNDLRLRGTDSAANQGIVRFSVDNNNKLFIDPANDGSNRFVINSNGNVGIGTTFPTEKLDIYSDGNAVVRLESAGGGVGMLDVGTDFTINNRINTNLIFKTSNAERMRITNNGSVGINTSSPNERLSLKNNGDIGISLENTADTSGNYWKLWQDNWNGSSNFTFNINYGGTDFLTATTAGNVGIGITNPTRKLNVNGNVGINNQLLLDSPNYNEHLSIRRGVYGYNIIVTGTRIDYSPTASTDTFKFLANLQTTGQLNVTGNSIINGNVGIGTTSPSDNLEIGTNGSVDTAFRMYSDQSGKYFRINSGGNFTELRTTGDQNLIIQSSGTAGYVTFQAGNSERMRINYNGNVGIGTSSPASKLTVTGGDAEVTGSDKGLILESPNGTRYRIKVDNSGNLTTTAV